METQGQSMLLWALHSLGWFYALVIPGTGLLVFLGACLVVALSRRPSVIAAYLVFLPLPLMIGMLGSIGGMIDSLSIIAHSSMAPKPSDVGVAVSTSLFTTYVGLLMTFPSLLVLGFGLLLRAIFADSKRT